MAKKRRKGPPPNAQKWIEQRRKGEQQGLPQTEAHANSIWTTGHIPERYKPAKKTAITKMQTQLGVRFPASIIEQLMIQNGGPLAECNPMPFDDNSLNWTNATVDGISQVNSWIPATEDHWFESVDDVPDLQLLIRIASHSESQLCLDYRDAGADGMPGLTYIDVSATPTEVTRLTDSADDFIQNLVAARQSTFDA